jgi:hypothetical protein
MKMNRSSVMFEYRLLSGFEEVRKKLLSKELADRLDKPLAFWALPSDRSSPIALLGRTVRELLATPFDELYATPGIGQKKIRSLVELLERAARPHPPGGAPYGAPASLDVASATSLGGIDPSLVSEALWVEWRTSVQTHDLGKETMGRCASSLQDLPRVIWNTPLDAYTGLSLHAIRSLKTHGEKRVRAVLEVFGSLHAIVGRMNTPSHLAVRIMPRFVAQVEDRIHALCQQPTPVTVEQIRRQFVDPLMAQVRVDLGDPIARLAESRLALDGSGATVRQVARRLNLTRARVYQLLNDVGAIMLVRWPEATAHVRQLRDRLEADGQDGRALKLFEDTEELFFADKRRETGTDSLTNGRPTPVRAVRERQFA